MPELTTKYLLKSNWYLLFVALKPGLEENLEGIFVTWRKEFIQFDIIQQADLESKVSE